MGQNDGKVTNYIEVKELFRPFKKDRKVCKLYIEKKVALNFKATFIYYSQFHLFEILSIVPVDRK